MNTYILILTIAMKNGYAGMGGIAMQEFNSLDSCQDAGRQWETVTEDKADDRFNTRAHQYYLCVEK